MAPVRLLPSYFCFIARANKPLGFVTSNWPGCGQHRLQVDGSRRGYDDKFWSDLQICRTQTRTCTARASKAPAYNNQNIVTYLHNQNYLQQHVGLWMTVIWTACYWNFTAVCLSVCAEYSTALQYHNHVMQAATMIKNIHKSTLTILP